MKLTHEQWKSVARKVAIQQFVSEASDQFIVPEEGHKRALQRIALCEIPWQELDAYQSMAAREWHSREYQALSVISILDNMGADLTSLL